jgi:probable FeS assembly SUF system protein SufT
MPAHESITLKRDCDSIAIPSGARQTLPAGTTVRVLQAMGGSCTVTNNIGAMFRIDARDADALGLPAPSEDNQLPGGPVTEAMVRDQLKKVFDPEIPVNIVDLGLVYACAITPVDQEGSRIDIKMTMTAPGCGMSEVLKTDVESKLSRLPGVKQTHVEVVFDPPWNSSFMSEAARLQLGLDVIDSAPSPFPIFQGR